ncbi:MAG: response regulator [Pseudomonadota bacterium]
MAETILITEDDEQNRKLFKDILQVAGYGILEARDGLEALVLAREKRPDLILMDVQMPVMDGLEAVKQLKADPATRLIPIIAISAFAMDRDEDRALAAGCDGYLSKPFGVKAFRDMVALYLLPGPRG